MESKFIKSFFAGIIGTAVMSFIMFVAPMMGIPKMNPSAMLAGIMSMPIAVGWLIHFGIGIIFAAFYVFLFAPKIRIKSKILKGATFGFIAFIFAQIAMGVMDAVIGGLPEPEGAMVGIILGGILGHVVFGIFVALSVKE